MRRVVLASALLAMSACGPGAPEPAHPEERTQAVPIAADIAETYSRAEWSDTWDQYGQAGIERVQRLRVAAAEKHARSWSCDRVASSDIAPSRSTPDRPVVFVMCDNDLGRLNRHYYSEADLGI